MSRGLHLLGYDQKRMASAVTKALAEGLTQGATGQRESVAPSISSTSLPPPPPLPPEKMSAAWYESDIVWYVAGGAAVVVLLFLLGRLR